MVWALEWNKSLRVVGAIAQPDCLPEFFAELPAMPWQELGLQDNVRTRMRREMPISEEQDILFSAVVEQAEISK